MSFYNTFGNILRNTPPELIFTADETMMQASFSKKVGIPNSMRQYMESKRDSIPHMTCMCCASLVGAPVPLYMIFKNRTLFPEELLSIHKASLFGLGSSPSGWMNRFTFFHWVVHFISFITKYRMELDPITAAKAVVLITDGHISRSCPLALQLLQANNIRLITLPAHSTHILQVFDVSLASPLKNFFSDFLREYLCSRKYEIPGNDEATLRRCSFMAIVAAWQKACTIDNCLSGAEKVGICPYNPEKAVSNEYVRELTEYERNIVENRRRLNRELNINLLELTHPRNVEMIRQYMLAHNCEAILCKPLHEFGTYQRLFHDVFVQAKAVRSPQISRPSRCCECVFYGFMPGW